LGILPRKKEGKSKAASVKLRYKGKFISKQDYQVILKKLQE
jgi:hypothetical protein